MKIWRVGWDRNTEQTDYWALHIPDYNESELTRMYGDRWKVNPDEGRFATEHEAIQRLIQNLEGERDALSDRISELTASLQIQRNAT